MSAPPPPPPPPSTAAAGATQAALLDAAEALFSERGYAGVSTREIVENAGANIAAIKYHFGSKQELYLAVLRRAMSRPESDEIWSVLPVDASDASPEQAATAIAQLIQGFLAHIIDEASSDTAPSLLCREAFEPSAAFGDVVEEYIKPRTERIEATIRVLVPEACDDRVRALGQGILGMVLHYKSFYEIQSRLWLGREPSQARVELIAQTLAGFSLRGLGCDEALVASVLSAMADDAKTDQETR